VRGKKRSGNGKPKPITLVLSPKGRGFDAFIRKRRIKNVISMNKAI
jgi:hypothetical protein